MSRLPPPSLSVKLPPMENTPSSELTPTRLGFPNEFPYEFDSPAFTPGFTSPGDSTETEGESSDDEEDFLAGLTRRLAPSTQRNSLNTKPEEKRHFATTSPQSTLSGLGSFSNSGNQSPNYPNRQPPTTSFRRDNAWDVISAAAGEVAKLKMSSYEPLLPRQNSDLLLRRQNAAFQADHQNAAFQADHQNAAFQADHQNAAFKALDQSLQQQRILDQMWLCSQSRIKSSENHYPKRVMNRETTLENLRYLRKNSISTATWLPQNLGTPLKRPSAGTGVFLPRRYPATTPSESNKKPVNTRVMLQSKVNFDEFTNGGPRLNQFDYECMIARSRLVAAHQRNLRSVNGGGCLIQERSLPQDWMY